MAFGRKKEDKPPGLLKGLKGMAAQIAAAEEAATHMDPTQIARLQQVAMERLQAAGITINPSQGAPMVIMGGQASALFGGATTAPPVLPTVCPNCGAVVTPEEVDEAEPTCKFCRAILPVQRATAPPPPLNVPGGGAGALAGFQGGLPQALIDKTHINADYDAVLAQGTWCRADIISASPLPGTNARGEAVTLLTMRASADGKQMWATACGVHVPEQAQYLARAGVNVPAKFISTQENVIAVDWAAAMQEQPGS